MGRMAGIGRVGGNKHAKESPIGYFRFQRGKEVEGKQACIHAVCGEHARPRAVSTDARHQGWHRIRRETHRIAPETYALPSASEWLRRLIHEAAGFEPKEEVAGPGVGVGVGGFVGEADAVAAFFVDVEVVGDAGFLQGGGKLQAIFSFDGFVFPGVPDETGRGVGGDLEFVAQGFDQVFGGFFAEEVVLRSLVGEGGHGDDGVAEDAEVGPAALAVDGVG